MTKIMYCRVGWTKLYRGNEKPVGGGSYTKKAIGGEIYNYLGVDGEYYGFFEPGETKGKKRKCPQIEKLGANKGDDFVKNILVIWVAPHPDGGQTIVGWYKNSTVYREIQTVPQKVLDTRKLKSIDEYNVFSTSITLLDVKDRNFKIYKGTLGQNQFSYGKGGPIDEKVEKYVKDFDSKKVKRVGKINSAKIKGVEKEALVKIRVNHDIFRKKLLVKYKNKCAICGVNKDELLIASHIKPWSKSDSYEKLDSSNGLLLCANHDSLFDKGFITFSDKGNINISGQLNKNTVANLNINKKMKVKMSESMNSYMKYHREKIFKK